MALNKVACVLIFLTVQAPVCRSSDPIVDMLKDKVLALESSLMTDIKLLRVDMNKISDELGRLPALLKASLNEQVSPISGDVKKTLESDKTSSYTREEYEQFTLRIKRAFTEEKVQTRRIMGELKSEIARFGERQVQGLAHLEEKRAESMGQLLKHFEKFKKETAAELKHSQATIQTGLTEFINRSFVQAFGSQIQSSVDTMTNTVTSVRKQCVSGLESMSLINKQQTSVVNESMAAISLDISNKMEQFVDDVAFIKSRVIPLDISNKMEQFVDDVAFIKSRVRFINGEYYSTNLVRLVNMTHTADTVGGRLEVYYEGEWGTVCDDVFGMNDAAVACRMLGLSGAHSYRDKSFYGRGQGKTWMDDLRCTGSETSLFDCSRIGAGSPGNEDCGHNEDVAVICKY